MFTRLLLMGTLLIGLSVPTLARASVTLDAGRVSPDAPLTMTFHLSGGCHAGATTALRITVPDALADLKPATKAGWISSVVPAPQVPNTGAAARADTQVTWRAEVPQADPEAFSLSGTMTDAAVAGTTLYFPVTQECVGETRQWGDIPAAGQELGQLGHPAPFLAITAAPSESHKVFLIDQLRVTLPTIRPVADTSATAAAYMDVENRGGSPDRLIGASIDGVDQVTIEAATQAGTQGLDVPPDGKLTLRTGAAHLDLKGVHRAFNPGDQVAGTVRFQRAGPLVLTFSVGGSPTSSNN